MLILLYYISPVKIFRCVKYYKAQPYNMEHTLCVCRQRIEKFDEFKEIFDLNCSVDDLSGRRKSQKWGWINKHFFSEEFQKNVENK